MNDALFHAAANVCRSYWEGSDKSKIDLRQAMTELRLQVNDEMKRQVKADTTRLTKDRDHA